LLVKKKNKILFILVAMMVLTVIASNYLVQFPIQYYNLDQILTYGAFSYPISFLITDLSNRFYGKKIARNVVNIGFLVGVLITIFVSTNFKDLISIRIGIGSGVAFLIAQNLDVNVFDRLRNNQNWYVAPFVSSLLGSAVDTILFFSIAFYNTGIPWVTLALGDFVVKLLMAFSMLIPFRLLLKKIKSVSGKNNLSAI
jgi:queuosine precursor transporter